MNEKPDTIYGRLLESVHISGYSFERACQKFKWLLTGGHWKTIGPGYDDIDKFIASINFAEFKISIEQRKEIAKMLEVEHATQRATARMLGVHHSTIAQDLGGNPPKPELEAASIQDIIENIGGNPPNTSSGAEVAKMAEKVIEKENRKLALKEKIASEKSIEIKDLPNIDLRIGDFKSVLSDVYNIDAIITDPPYPKEYLSCFSDLSKYASEHLKEDGFCVVYSGQYNLPEVIKRMSEYLTYVWTFCLYHVGKKQLVNGVNIMCGWKPVLIFSRGRKKMRYSAYDIVESKEREKNLHEWQQSESGVTGLIEIFTEPGQLIVDPFTGSGTFLKMAHLMNRKAIGAEIDTKKG